MNRCVNDLFRDCAESDFNPDIVTLALPDAYKGGFVCGFVSGAAVTGLVAFAISQFCKRRRIRNERK